jgi:hypothetical protein
MFTEIAQVVALITVLGTVIYVLGLVALCWPIYRSLTRDPSTGLYAAALVPRTVVAGQGVRIFVGFPLISALFLLIVVALVRWGRGILEGVLRPLGVGDVLHQLLLGIVATATALCFIFIVKRLRTEGLFDFFFTPLDKPDASPFRLLSLVISGIGGAIGGWLILGADQVSWETLLLALVFFFGAVALAGVPDAVSIDPPLPKVKVAETTKTGEEKQYEGKLLTHAEAHWYVFDDDEKVLHMIPDDKADVVCVQAK